MMMRRSRLHLGSVNRERWVWEARITVIAKCEFCGPPFAKLCGGTAPLAYSLGKSLERGSDVIQLFCLFRRPLRLALGPSARKRLVREFAVLLLDVQELVLRKDVQEPIVARLNEGPPSLANPRNVEVAVSAVRPQPTEQLGTVNGIEAPHKASLPRDPTCCALSSAEADASTQRPGYGKRRPRPWSAHTERLVWFV